jgi:hypothetical protein
MNTVSTLSRSGISRSGSASQSDFEWLVGEIAEQIRSKPCPRRAAYVNWALRGPLARISDDINALDHRRRGDALRALAEAAVDEAHRRVLN